MKKNAEYIGVDEKYIPEEERYVEGNSKKDSKILKGIGIGYLIIYIVIFLITIVVFAIILMNFININNNRKENFKNTQVNDNSEMVDSIIEEYYNN